jgi:pyruvate dehydrogenase E2 component (dihydrolipoamide acetyltransferase)
MPSIDVKVPDIGDFKNIPVIEIFVKPGDIVKRDDPLVTLESDKAAMELPSPDEGQVAEILVKIGDRVSQGAPILRLTSSSGHIDLNRAASESPPEQAPKDMPATQAPPVNTAQAVRPNELPLGLDFSGVHAGPSVRRLARELDIDLTRLMGTGEKGRITKEDVKRALAGPSAAATGAGIPEIPAQDFSKFGPVETHPMSRLRRLSGPHLHRAWLNIPHVTHIDEADITDLESYRKTLDAAAKDKGYRVTLLAFLMKASVVALKEHPEFNASLSPDKAALILKRYYNIGVAVDTPDGLVVPVIRDVDRKGITELSQELGAMSQKMRDGKIAPADIQGGTFSISSLGGIGGTAFTPIINAPEVAILGVVKAETKPRWDGAAFQPRLMLPLCLSFDHRVIDGALAARFTRRLAGILEDLRQLIL